MMKNKLKNFSVCLLAVISLLSMNVLAASSSFNVSYQTYGGSGSVSGKDNGVYHRLDEGSAYLTVNSSSDGRAMGGLYLSSAFFDEYYGAVHTNVGTHMISSYVEASSKYYLVFKGGKAMSTISISGSLHN